MCGVAGIQWILIVIGGINWGLVGLGWFFGADWNVIHMIFGSWAGWLEAIIYIVVGIAAVMSLFHGGCKHCEAKATGMGGMKKDMPMGGQM
jgi:uncharacterized membrane protein YuzA (DUF378 family)